MCEVEREVELECAVYGEGGIFPVKIARDAKVSALQEAIADILSTEQHSVPPRLVTLYLAKKNGAWLKDDGSVNELLSGKPNTAYKKLRPTWKLSKKECFGDFELGEEVIHILVEPPTQHPPASIKKQLRYKVMSTEASCRKFLDALARELSAYYDFDFYYAVPTIGDVFHAVDNGSWAFRMKKCKAVTTTALPDYFTKDEWKALKDLNKRTTLRIHDGKVPTTSKGKSYIILPHDIFSDDEVSRFKSIAAKGNVVFVPTDLDVIDEDEFSGSSRSSRAHSADA